MCAFAFNAANYTVPAHVGGLSALFYLPPNATIGSFPLTSMTADGPKQPPSLRQAQRSLQRKQSNTKVERADTPPPAAAGVGGEGTPNQEAGDSDAVDAPEAEAAFLAFWTVAASLSNKTWHRWFEIDRVVMLFTPDVEGDATNSRG